MNMATRFGSSAPPNTPLLTLADVEQWQEELREKRAQRQNLDQEIAELEARLKHAEPFVKAFAANAINSAKNPESPPGQPVEPVKPVSTVPKAKEQESDQNDQKPVPLPIRPPGRLNVTTVIEEIAIRVGRDRIKDGFDPKDIVNVIQSDPSVDPGVRQAHQNYPYSVLKRMVRDGRVERRDGRYFITALGLTKPVRTKLPKARLVNPGFKQVPLTKEEKIRIEVTDMLARAEGPVHRSQIVDYLREVGVFTEKDTTSYLSVYLSGWDEFVADGKGHYTLINRSEGVFK